MASYDSDSSSDEENLDVQTNVTLGYASSDPTGDEISHTGGHPTFLDPASRPSGALAKCKVCNGYMSLLLQLHADLQTQFPDDERRLFIWCCRRKACSKKAGSVRAFREVRKAKVRMQAQATPKQEDTASQQKQQSQNLGSQLFGGSPTPGQSSNSNPFSSSSSQTQTPTNPFSTSSSTQTNGNGTSSLPPLSSLAAKSPQPPTQSFADKLKISPDDTDTAFKITSTPTDSTPWPPSSSFPSPLPTYNLDAESEYLEPTPSSQPGPSNSTPRITDLDDHPQNSTSTSSKEEKDLYESPHDRTFTHFTRILSQNPEQILRYDFGGTPLLYNSSDAVATHFVLPGHHLHQNQQFNNNKIKTAGPVKGIRACQSCGGARVFEVQLVPYLIYELEKDNEEAMKIEGGEGMEWGTILVGSCSKNCGVEGQVSFREEWVGVQWEEGGVQLKQRQ